MEVTPAVTSVGESGLDPLFFAILLLILEIRMRFSAFRIRDMHRDEIVTRRQQNMSSPILSGLNV